MATNNAQLKKLSRLLTHFLDKKIELSEEILHKSERFIFYNDSYPELKNSSELYDTLVYLKDVKNRNFLKDIHDLMQYYEKKLQGINELFDKYEQAQAEEQLAIRFQSACEMHLKITGIQNLQKSELLYYPISPEAHYLVGYENISYKNSIEEEKKYLSQIEGNHLAKQKNVTLITSEKNNQLTSN